MRERFSEFADVRGALVPSAYRAATVQRRPAAVSAIPPAVYVIDDDPSVRKALGRLIRSAGFEAETFADAEAFLAATSRAPACLIVDVGLPGMSGLELLATSALAAATFPVIVISARDDDQVRRSALSLGASAFFAKPLPDDDFLRAVEGVATGETRRRES